MIHYEVRWTDLSSAFCELGECDVYALPEHIVLRMQPGNSSHPRVKPKHFRGTRLSRFKNFCKNNSSFVTRTVSFKFCVRQQPSLGSASLIFMWVNKASPPPRYHFLLLWLSCSEKCWICNSIEKELLTRDVIELGLDSLKMNWNSPSGEKVFFSSFLSWLFEFHCVEWFMCFLTLQRCFHMHCREILWKLGMWLCRFSKTECFTLCGSKIHFFAMWNENSSVSAVKSKHSFLFVGVAALSIWSVAEDF